MFFNPDWKVVCIGEGLIQDLVILNLSYAYMAFKYLTKELQYYVFTGWNHSICFLNLYVQVVCTGDNATRDLKTLYKRITRMLYARYNFEKLHLS